MPLLALGIVQPSTDERSRDGLASLGERLERGAIPSYIHTPNVQAALALSTAPETSAGLLASSVHDQAADVAGGYLHPLGLHPRPPRHVEPGLGRGYSAV
jgi:hypothetical protein